VTLGVITGSGARGSRLRRGFPLRGSRWTPRVVLRALHALLRLRRARVALPWENETLTRARRFTRAYLPVGRTIPIRGKIVTPTVATGSARAAREVDAGSHGEGGDGRGGSHAARGTPRARPARHQRATASSRRSRENNCARRARIPVREKSHINSPTRRFAGAAAARRRDSRRAAAGAHSRALTARATRRARRGVSSRARAGGPAFRARHLANTAF